MSGGVIEGLSPKWKRGSARWVRDVLVWSKAPFMLRNELVPVDRLLGEHPAHASGVKRLGDNPVVVEFASGGATIGSPEGRAPRPGHGPANDRCALEVPGLRDPGDLPS